MAVIVSKTDLPQIQYTPVKFRGETTLFGIISGGMVIIYTSIDEIRFVPWEELVAFGATAPITEFPETKEEKKGKPREIK